MFAGKKSAQIREILISESAWEEMTCLFAPSLTMGIISWIIFGLIAGILAKWIMPGKDGGGFIVTIVLGVIGAVVGGWISTFFGFGKVDGFNFGSFVVAVIGALVVLFIYRKIKS
ncbi:hypothetical protein WP3W18E06_22040 [Raoultella ornithinolytica]|nr:hypothetical protein WP3W18E06_22040 [Raoultella ornithinolytica]